MNSILSNCSKPTDQRWRGVVVVERNDRVAEDTYQLRFRAPEIASLVVPGQFVMLRLAGMLDPLLGRPLAVYDVGDEDGRATTIDVVYLTVGRMTGQLAEVRPGTMLDVWGPLGNGFPALEVDHLVMVAGGIGQTPFLMLAREYLGGRTYGCPPRSMPRARRVTFCQGAKTAARLACVEDFERAGVEVRLATDDGSRGHHGLVTELIGPAVESGTGQCRIVCCGPEPMMEAAARIAKSLDVPCQVSLETPMACGIGICFSCVAKIRDGQGGWDYRRTCTEGPVFDAESVDFS